MLVTNSSKYLVDFSRYPVFIIIWTTCRSANDGFRNRDDKHPLNVLVNNKFVDLQIMSSISVCVKFRSSENFKQA